VSEKTPVISACEAMTVAGAAMATSAIVAAPLGTIPKNGLAMARGSLRIKAPWPK